MRGLLDKYTALIHRGIGLILEYRASMVIWMLSASFPLVMLAVWLSLAEQGPVGGYTAGDFIAYYLMSFYLRQMTSVWVAWELDYEIRHGDLSVKLLHPLNPIHEYITFNLADKIVRAMIFTPIVILVVLFVPGVSLVITPLNIALFVVALIGAWFLRFMYQFTLGLLTFWVSRALVVTEVFWMLLLLFGGGVAPLELLPEPLQTIAYYLPFRFMMAFPIQIMMGQLSFEQVLTGLATTAAWVAGLFVVYRWLWRRGVRQFSAFGA